MIHKWVSAKTVISKVYRDLNLQAEDRDFAMIEWIAEALNFIGAFPQYKKKATQLTVECGRAPMPCDMINGGEVQLSKNGIALNHMTGTFDQADYFDKKFDKGKPEDCKPCKEKGGGDYYNNNGFNSFTTTRYGPSYAVNGKWYNFNFEKGCVDISYTCMVTDCDGFPLVPEEESYLEACSKYVAMKMLYPKYLTGKIPVGIYERAEFDWQWYCGQARGDGLRPSYGEMQNWTETWSNLLFDKNAYWSHDTNEGIYPYGHQHDRDASSFFRNSAFP